MRSPYRIVSGQSDEWRLLFFVRLAIELLTAGSQAADGAGFQLFASRSKGKFLSFRTPAVGGSRGRVERVLEGIGHFFAWLVVFNFGLLVILLLLAAMLVGSAKVLPVLPQALGGAALRVVRRRRDRTDA